MVELGKGSRRLVVRMSKIKALVWLAIMAICVGVFVGTVCVYRYGFGLGVWWSILSAVGTHFVAVVALVIAANWNMRKF